MKNWTKEAVFYQIYPLGFCGAQQYHQEQIDHRIKKIIDWIPHLKQLHINALYLGPVFESYEHGYDTSDYQVIDHRLGDHQDFKDVCVALHDAQIRVVLDGVFNHVGRNFWAFKDVQNNGIHSQYCSWFQHLNFDRQSPLGDPFTYEAWEGHYNLVKLNLENEDVVQYLLQSIAMWIDEYHIDGIRLDAADCINRDFFRRLKLFCAEKNPDLWLMGEIIHGDYTTWANQEMLDSVTNYECYKGLYSSHNEKNYFEIGYSLNRQFGKGGIYKDLVLYNFVDNHDVNRIANTAQNALDLPNIYTLLYTMPGIPSIYYGSEWAIKGTKHNGSDADLRPCLDIESIPSSDLLDHIVKLGFIKKILSPLSHGTYEQLLLRNEQFVFLRKDNHQAAYIFLNVSEEPYQCQINVPFKAMRDVLEDTLYYVKDCVLTILLAPKSSYIVVEDNEQTIQHTEKPMEVVSRKLEEVEQPKVEEKKVEEQKVTEEKIITPDNLPIGRYQHFKGNHYAVLYHASHSETLENYIVYRQLYGDESVWVRPSSMFFENVEVNGKSIPRFQYIGK